MKQFLRYIFTLAAMLMMVVGNAWAWRGAKAIVISEPEQGGWVYVGDNAPSSWTKTEDYQEKEDWGAIRDKNFTFNRFHNAGNNYTFKGWAENTNSNTGDLNSSCTVAATSGTKWGTKTYYAIFATLQYPAQRVIEFTETRVGNFDDKSFTIKHAHAGTVSLSLSDETNFSIVSPNSINSTSLIEDQTITVKFQPQTAGEHTAILTISSNNGLTPLSITLKGNATNLHTLFAEKKTDLLMNSSYNPNEVFNVYYIANNQKQTISDFSIKSLDPTIADYVGSKIQTNHNTGDARFVLTRNTDENFYALNKTITVKVTPSTEVCSISTSEISTETGTGDNSTSEAITLNGVGDRLSFSYKLHSNANTSHYLTTQYSTTESGDNFQDIANSQVGEEDTKLLSHSLTLPEGTKRIRFKRTDNGGGNKKFQISNITITRKQFLTTSITGTLELPTTAINLTSSNQFKLYWSTCSDDIKVVCSSSHFTINPSTISSEEGSQDITVSINTATAGTHEGTITIYDQSQKITIPVKCIVNDKSITKISGTTSHTLKVNGGWGTDFTFDKTASSTPTEKTSSNNPDFYYTIVHTLSDNSSQKPGYEGKVISYDPTTNKIIAHNAGTAILTIKHNETNYHYASNEFTCTITVEKHEPSFTWSDPVNFNKTISDYFTTTNQDTKLTILAQSDMEVALLHFNTNDATDTQTLDLTTYNKPGSTTVRVHQTSNWYWAAIDKEHTITPQPLSNHVPFTMNTKDLRMALYEDHEKSYGENQCDDNGTISLNQSGGLEVWTANPLYYTIKFSGIPDKLTFKYKMTLTATAIGETNKAFIVYESANGNDWSELWTTDGMPSNTDYKEVFNIQLNPDTRYLKFFYDGTYTGYYSDVSVTELNEFYAVETSDEETKTEIEHLYFNEEGKPNQIHATATRTFDIKYANAGYKVTAISNDNHFTVTPATTNQIGGEKHGLYTFTVNYTAREPYSTTDNNSYITLTDELGHKDIVYLHASSDKFHQTLRWKDEIAAVGEDKPYVVRKTVGEIINAAIASSDLTITYESTNTEVIKVEGTKLILVGPGETTITAKQNGNDLYYPATSISKPFVVTDKLLQYIIWNDAPTDIIKTDGTQQITLTAQVYVQTEDENNPFVLSPERTKALTYKSANTNIVSVAGNILTVGNIGKTTLTAQVPETDEYAAAELTVPVTVRNETAGCEDILLYGPTEEPIQFFQYDLNEIAKEPIALDRTTGIPGYVELEHYGESWSLVIQYYAAEIRVEESVDGQNWTNKKTIYPVKNQINKDTINLSRNATHIRFVRNYGGQGYQFLQDIKVHPAQYLETYSPESTTAIEEIDFGEIHVGSKNERSFDVHYSNIKSELSPVPSHSDITATPNFGYCGAFGTQTIKITWTPSSVKDNAEETIKLWDQNSGMEKTVKLKARIKKGPQNINWSNWGGEAPTTISHCNLIEEFPTMTTADLPIKWEVTDGTEFANFVAGTSQLQLIDNGTITLKASSKETDTYLAFEQTFTITIEAKPIFLGTMDSNWDNVANWNFNRLPCEVEIATLQAPATLSSHATIAGLIFAESGKLHITSVGGMTIGAEGITNAAINGNSITIDNTREGAGFLRISPAYKGTMPYITMRYQTKSTLDSGANKDATWQYIGAPGADCSIYVDHNTWLYHWSEAQGWINKTGKLTLEPFAGYAITQYGKPTYELVSTVINEDKTITLTKTETGSGMNGDNLFANSYSAPLDAKNFTPEDFSDYGKGSDDIVKTFYIFNSGSWNDWNKQENTLGSNNSDTPGQYRAIPALAADYLNTKYDQTTISPMQGVYMIANTNGATITLNYDKHVWQAGNKGGTNMHEPMRAPGHNIYKPDNFRRLRIQVNSANSGADRMYVIQDTITTTDYDNGYDAPNQLAEGLANIYTNEHFGQMEVSCSNHIDSTFIGFTAGSDSLYTLRFNAIIGDDLHLLDLDNDSLILLEEDATYTFHATPHSKNDLRFQILLHPEKNLDFGTEEKDELYSGVTDVHTTQVWSHGSYIYINNVPANTIATLYNISGHKLLATPIHQTPYTLDLSYLPKGVYMLQLNTQVYKFVIQ